MRALVISDTRFGAWTGRDLLAEEFFLERLAPQLEDIDELIFLGDFFDFLFGAVEDAVDAADGLLRLIAEKMAGGRLVFLAGNHDHHLVHRDDEDRLETKLASGHRPSVPPGPAFFREFLERRWSDRDRLSHLRVRRCLTHGRYPHARLSGSRGDNADTVGDRRRRP